MYPYHRGNQQYENTHQVRDVFSYCDHQLLKVYQFVSDKTQITQKARALVVWPHTLSNKLTSQLDQVGAHIQVCMCVTYGAAIHLTGLSVL